jgi:protein-L-isoaspartate(D-aspartate) O-methyltransferase
VTDRVAEAMDAIDYDHYVVEPDGSDLPQSSNERVIKRMVEALNVAPGQRVLEIGTGSGYTAALLAHLVAPGGAVTSVDVDASLVERARQRHADSGTHGAEFHAGDGYDGWPANAPYDRIVGWACPHLIPDAWIKQAAADAIIVTPVKVAPLAAASTIATLTMANGQPAAVEVSPGGFIEMHDEPITELGLPVRYVDAADTPSGEEPWWISAEWLRAGPAQHATDLLDLVRSDATTTPQDLGGDTASLFAWLYATRPDGLTTAGILDGHLAVGATTPGSAALLTHTDLVTAGSDDARTLLDEWTDQWRAQGRPGWDRLTGVTEHTEDGLAIRLATAATAHNRRE